MTFLKNQWYVAGRADELGVNPLGRTICGEPIVFFRRADGSVAALEDRCPHRKYALSKGTVLGDELQCGYHGVQLDGAGRCTRIPSQVHIPRGFGIRAFPAIERYALLHVWMGDPALADPTLVHDWHWNDAPGWTAVHGYHHVKGHYQLVIDNLLDLTHLAVVHKGTLAGPGILETPLEVKTEGDVVRSYRFMRSVDPSPILTIYKKFSGKIDRVQDTWFRAPGYIGIIVHANPTGTDDPRPVHVVVNSVTPETERSTHYFWSLARCQAVGDSEVDRIYREITYKAFDEDQAVIEIQQNRIDSDAADRPLAYFDGDKASLAARRIIAQKLDEESTAPRAVA